MIGIRLLLIIPSIIFCSYDPVTSEDGFLSGNYRRVAIATKPIIHHGGRARGSMLRCMLECNRLPYPRCTGASIHAQTGLCLLYKGVIAERDDDAMTHSDSEPHNSQSGPVYKLQPLHRCDAHKGFSLYQGQTDQDLYCFAFSSSASEMRYEAARTACEYRGSYLTFVDSWLKHSIVTLGIVKKNGGLVPYWIGARRDREGKEFQAEFPPNRTLSLDNPLWYLRKPGDGSCVVTKGSSSITSVDCDDVKHVYSCEIFDFLERPYRA